jgi:predicted membrane channel-forming protein YqfA (hemolysin III family)
MVTGALLTLFLSFLLFRKLPSRPLKVVIYVLVAFFTLIYPLSGLLTELSQQNAFNMLLQAGLILFITGLSLYVNGRKPEDKSQAA